MGKIFLMLQNFLKITLRNFTRHKIYSLVNISGLITGMACCLLIFSYVAYERSYDSFNPRAGRIYRVQDEEYQNGRMVVPCASAMPGVAPAMIREFPEVENACRLCKQSFLLGNYENNMRFREYNIYYADPSVIDIFDLSMLEGDPKNALSGPGKVILSASDAKKYFGHSSPLGKRLTIYGGDRVKSLEVTGVFRDYPSNSHIKMGLLISYKTYSQVIGTYGSPNDILETSFGWTDFYTYVLLRPGSDTKRVSAKLGPFIDRHYNDLPENKNEGDRYSLSLMPLRSIHLDSHYTEEMEANGDGQSVNFLFLIAFLIIAIAWINYINLATARSLERAREVGMRKVLGAMRHELIRQFMLESFLLNLLALAGAIALTLILHPAFSKLTGRALPPFLSVRYGTIFAFLFICGTLLSGIYPALVLSRYRPIVVLKGAFKNAAGGLWLRKSLITGQFAASVILIAGTVIVFKQVHFMRSQQLGVNIDKTIVIKGPSEGWTDSVYRSVYQVFKHELLQMKEVKNITVSSNAIGQEILWSTNWHRMRAGSPRAVNLFHLSVDDNFINSYGLKMMAGRAFSSDPTMDRKAIILNETAVKALGLPSPQSAIGDLLSVGDKNFDSMEVVGVVADFHNEGLQKAIQPLVLFPNAVRANYYSVKIDGRNTPGVIASIKKLWGEHFSVTPFEYFFLDEFFDSQYQENERFGNVFGLFAIIAIGIACFGLMGLSAYNVLQRTKEIGIRKVLGASVQSILLLLSVDFLYLVLVATLIAVPVIWWAMNSWLESFAYRTNISWWIYLSAGAFAILIAMATVAIQSFRASAANPVKSLRTE